MSFELDHEEAFLSCYFTDAVRTQDALIEAGLNMTSAMFKDEDNKRIYSAIMSLIDKSITVDFMSVKCKYNELYKPLLANVSYLIDLSGMSIRPGEAWHYAEYIFNNHKRKVLKLLLENSLEQLKGKTTADEVEQQLIIDYENVSGIMAEKINIKTQLDLSMEYMEKAAQLKELETQGLGKTGIKAIDENIFFDAGYTFFIGGRSGTGKTTLGYQLLNKYCEAYKTHGLFFSLEMPGVPLFRRSLVTEYAEVNLSRLSPEYMRNAIRGNMEKIICNVIEKNNRVLVCDSSGLNLKGIEQTINNARRKYKNLGVICIDYIGYIKPEAGKTITEQVANIAKGLKELAKKLNIRVMVLSQLNREGGTDGTTPVSVHHFKDSGAIEESADIAIGMWRSASDKNRVHCSILKNREGELDIKFDFIKYATYMQESDLLEEEVEKKPTNRSRYQVTEIKRS
ncbi:MAG TPA: hypothetical protein DCS19_02485 [Flavobacterium sp.]|nr:hypothetical protein [Flavobacterium sp.]